MNYNAENFPPLPFSWATTSVEDAAEVVSISKKVLTKDYLMEGELQVIDQGSNPVGGYTNDQSLAIETALPVVVFGDHTRAIKYITSPFAAGADGIKVLRPAPMFWPSTFFQFLRAIRLPDRGYARHFQFLRSSVLPVPPLPEQKRIADKLDALLARVDACRERLDRVPKILKRFRQSVLAAATSGELTREWGTSAGDGTEWDQAVLGDLVQDGPKNGLYKQASSYGSGTRILRIDNFYDGFVRPWEELKRLEVTAKERLDYGLAVGDIVINRVNSLPYLGKAALIRDLPQECVFESNMMRIRLEAARVRSDYAILFLTSPAGIAQLRSNAKHAVNQASINQTDVGNVSVPLPSLPEQAEIVRQVESLFAMADAIAACHENASFSVNRLAPSSLAKAFCGELVPQDPNDEPASELLARIRTQEAVTASAKPKRGNA